MVYECTKARLAKVPLNLRITYPKKLLCCTWIAICGNNFSAPSFVWSQKWFWLEMVGAFYMPHVGAGKLKHSSVAWQCKFHSHICTRVRMRVSFYLVGFPNASARGQFGSCGSAFVGCAGLLSGPHAPQKRHPGNDKSSPSTNSSSLSRLFSRAISSLLSLMFLDFLFLMSQLYRLTNGFYS